MAGKKSSGAPIPPRKPVKSVTNDSASKKVERPAVKNPTKTQDKASDVYKGIDLDASGKQPPMHKRGPGDGQGGGTEDGGYSVAPTGKNK